MNNNILNNKFFVAFLLFLIITFSFVSNCFAYSNDFKYDNTDYSYFIPDDAYKSFIESDLYKSNKYNYLLSCDNGTCRIYLWEKTKNVKIYQTSIINYYDSNISEYGCLYYTVRESGGTLNLESSSLKSFHNSCHMSGNKIYMLTNVNVYTDETCSKIFFQGSPVTAVEIPALETAEQIPEAMATALKIIIPVGLAILVIGLIIYLIKCVIYRMR